MDSVVAKQVSVMYLLVTRPCRPATVHTQTFATAKQAEQHCL